MGREIVSLLENDTKLHGMKKLVVDISDKNEKVLHFIRSMDLLNTED